MKRSHGLILAAALVAGCPSNPDAAPRPAPASSSAPSSAQPSAVASVSPAPPSSATPASARGFEGLYSVERTTRNRAGCDVEGPVVEPELKLFYLQYADSFGHRILTGGGTSSEEERSKLIRFESAMVSHPVVFTKGVDSPRPSGAVGQSAIPEDGICHGEAEEQMLQWDGADRIRVDIRLKKVDYPGKEMSDCGTNDSVKAAADKPCSELIVIRARRDGPLPEAARK